MMTTPQAHHHTSPAWHAAHIVCLACLMAAALCTCATAQRIMWWNVENLFDCQHDTLKNDEEFLPNSTRHWTPGRYWHKLDDISRTLAAASDGEEWPWIVGLAEVENDTVLRDLTLRSPLRLAHYKYVHIEGPDVRGIDCAMLYQPSRFNLLGSESISIPSATLNMRPTRDMLHTWGALPNGDTLHVICLHFPSRAGGSRQSAPHRRLAAETLCHTLDTLVGKKVLVMGDFNAGTDDQVFRIIGKRLVSLTPSGHKAKRKPQGTYCYQGLWDYIDHILVSESLLPLCSTPHIEVARFKFLLTDDGRPRRTYLGTTYGGGISDHLPIWADLFIR